MKSVMSHRFSRIPQAEIERSVFDRSHGYKTTFDAGYLVPCYVDEVLPGDSFDLRLTAFARLATPVVPIMDNLFMDFHFWFVPNRLLWSNWEKFNGSQDDPGDSTDFTVPQLNVSNGATVGTIYDYMGIPLYTAGGRTDPFMVNSLHFRAYNLIWNQWYRDENLQDSVGVPVDDGPDTLADFSLLRRGKRYDYFTSALPFPQKGTAVTLPLGTTANILWRDAADIPPGLGNGVAIMRDATGGTPIDADPSGTDDEGWGTDPGGLWAGGTWSGAFPLHTPASIDPDGSLYADLTTASAATINSLREAFQLQRMLERDARGGTRYTEVIRAHFGVISPDARLQRPEYLGGGSLRVGIKPVEQTSESGTTPQGNLAATGTVAGTGPGFRAAFTEHGVLIGLVSVRADLNYQQGLDRMWSRQTRVDFYWPAFAHLGEQAILQKELVVGASIADDDTVWGYQERFAEYRYKQSKITGLFNSNQASNIDIWHLAQDFGSTCPPLNAAFIVDDPPVDRVIATPTEPHFLYDSFIKLRCVRPMPVYGVPGFVDRF